ncbi:CPXCG motif-containing cysteine-rich protein [Marinihelvus fidelis]|uniref:CPXCG motif-containing cysteine-rich protein n=1 Tax=Marinihelvus fidelis TaxID=2613842 RepID=A0A5N0TF89_9GAMM|nr:CPXCG motif-containing cysteine-rich protein [Marinihelvus fidelis]KAA9133198.1 CPXCG motif-containing cysteine-rich protein [Marinihelvus fidelis]
METENLSCPYCGEPLELLVDDSAGAQRYIEDCAVCCKPIEVEVRRRRSDDGLETTLHRDDE